MKHLLLCFVALYLFSCHPNKRITSPSSSDTFSFSLDSLANINYFDYYGKTVAEMLENDVIRHAGASLYCSHNGFDHLSLYYDEDERFQEMKIYLHNPNVDCSQGEYGPNPKLEQVLHAIITEIKFKYAFKRIKNQDEAKVFIDTFVNVNFKNYYGKPISELISLPAFNKWSGIKIDTDFRRCVVAIFYKLNETENISLYLYLEDNVDDNSCHISTRNSFDNVKKRNLKEIKIRSRNQQVRNWLIETDAYLFDNQRPVTKSEAERKEFIEELLKINFENYYGQPVGHLLSLPTLERWTGKPYKDLDCSETLTYLLHNGDLMYLVLHMEPLAENVKGCFKRKDLDDIERGRILKKVEVYTLIEELKSIATEPNKE